MKFKYYLRGAGVGMIIATVILAIAFLFHRDLSDAEIMKRAMALGMVMEGAGQGGTLADSVPKKAGEEENTKKGSKIEAGQDSTTKSTAEHHDTATDETPDTSDLKENDEKADEKNQASVKTGENKEGSLETDSGKKEKSGQIVSITIRSGDVSRIVSARVQAAGLVDDASDFNTFLGKHGYDRLLHSGTYEIAVGSTYEQIAKVLTAK